MGSLEKIVLPEYKEGFDLISTASSNWAVDAYCELYQQVHQNKITKSTEPLPLMALGTMGLGNRTKESADELVAAALERGFQAVDTAPTYKNEEKIGKGIGDSSPFLIVKVPKRASKPDMVREELLDSLKKLGKKSVDLVLMHWPSDFIEAGTLEACWKELEQLQSEGACKQLGVCNFSIDALRSLLPFCKKSRPVVNQVERHPLLPQWELLDFCACQDIMLQAHTPLGHVKPELFEHEIVERIASERGDSVAQVLLKWNIIQRVATVVKCSSHDHQLAAVEVMDGSPLTPSEMEELDSIGLNEQVRFVAPFFMFKSGAAYSWGDRAPV
jgi:diketogulonate reductase-like aldo/keto reductase